MHDTTLRSLALGATLLATMACGSDPVGTGPKPSPENAPRQLIAGGSIHTCRIAGTATHCWGDGRYGQLGNGADTAALAPVLVGGGKSFVTLAAGWHFTCALTAAGEAYCWGYNEGGQLGSGDETRANKNMPVAVAGGHTFVALTSGDGHSCALTREGEAYCWGWNGEGGLGNGTTTSTYAPVRVNTALRFTRIAAYGNHTCALTREGAAYCWGANWRGNLGDSTLTSRRTPVAVVGGHTFVALGGGYDHTCALTAAGKTYCWGRNANGQLGIGTVDAVGHPVPAPVAGTVTLRSLTLGGLGEHTCGLTSAGAAYCWGYNMYGQVGNDTTSTTQATPVGIAPSLAWEQIATGNEHSCGLTTDGATYCWGYNYFGQLGDNSTTHRRTPTRVSATTSSARVVGVAPTLARGGASPATLPEPLRLMGASTR